jgi:hypothetical protein
MRKRWRAEAATRAKGGASLMLASSDAHSAGVEERAGLLAEEGGDDDGERAASHAFELEDARRGAVSCCVSRQGLRRRN